MGQTALRARGRFLALPCRWQNRFKRSNLMTKLRTLLATGAFAVATAFAAAPAQAQNVIDTAHQAGTFNTFLTAIDAAGMTDLLATSNPITVFAPTDEAFAEMGAGAGDSLR